MRRSSSAARRGLGRWGWRSRSPRTSPSHGAALRQLHASPTASILARQAGAPEATTKWLCRVEAWFAPVQRAIHTPNDLGDPWPAELVAVALREHAAGRLPQAVTRLQTAFE